MKQNQDICDIITGPWARHMLRLPLSVRLGICVASFPLCLFIYLQHIVPANYGGSILTIPLALAAWVFTRRGACICFFSLLFIQIVYNTIVFHSLLWPSTDILSFIIGTIVLFSEASIIVSLRTMLDNTEAARLKAEQGEQQIARAYEQQRQLSQMKNQFIMNVNHELRTPLAAAYGYFEFLQLMLEEKGYLDHATHATYIKDALRYCEDLRAMVNNVLDTMEIGTAGKPLKCEVLSLAAEICAVIEHNDFLRSNAHRLVQTIPDNLSVWADVRCLHHVLDNLLSNAFKFSPQDTTVTISATQNCDDAHYLRISVQDSGPGIPPEELPLLFQQFTRLRRDLGGAVRGIGLGLYISKHLIEAMQGSIWAESTGITGLGSCFSFTLPQAAQTLQADNGKTSTGYFHSVARPQVPAFLEPERQY